MTKHESVQCLHNYKPCAMAITLWPLCRIRWWWQWTKFGTYTIGVVSQSSWVTFPIPLCLPNLIQQIPKTNPMQPVTPKIRNHVVICAYFFQQQIILDNAIQAAKTWRKRTWPRTVKMSESPIANHSSLMPKVWLTRVTSNNCSNQDKHEKSQL